MPSARWLLAAFSLTAMALALPSHQPAQLSRREAPPSGPYNVSNGDGSIQSNGTAASNTSSTGNTKRYVGYWSIFHGPTQVPTIDQTRGLTHVILAFVYMSDYNSEPVWVGEGAKFTDAGIKEIQGRGIKVSVAIGGWGYDKVFRPAVASAESRSTFADKLVGFVKQHNLDGIDLDWEYPVDNGQDYKTDRKNDPTDGPNFVEFAKVLRTRLTTYGQSVNKHMSISIAAPARLVDLVPYNVTATTKGLDEQVDFWNLMSYDYMNRRESHSKHHTSADVVADTLAIYTGYGIKQEKLLIGFAMYAKWFETSVDATSCPAPHIGCDLATVYEKPDGADAGKSGWVTFNTAVADNQAMVAKWNGIGDHKKHDQKAWATTALVDGTFWTWPSEEDTLAACKGSIGKAGGAFFWALNQDSAGSPHLKQLQNCLGVA